MASTRKEVAEAFLREYGYEKVRQLIQGEIFSSEGAKVVRWRRNMLTFWNVKIGSGIPENDVVVKSARYPYQVTALRCTLVSSRDLS